MPRRERIWYLNVSSSIFSNALICLSASALLDELRYTLSSSTKWSINIFIDKLYKIMSWLKRSQCSHQHAILLYDKCLSSLSRIRYIRIFDPYHIWHIYFSKCLDELSFLFTSWFHDNYKYFLYLYIMIVVAAES